MPATAAEWHKQISDADLEGQSIFNLGSYDSGSKITHPQFLLLRVLWLKKDQSVFSKNLQSWIPQSEYEKAKRLPKASWYWHKYLEFKQTAAGLNGKELPDLGTFSLVRDSQCEVEKIENDRDSNSGESIKLSPIAHRTRARAVVENRLQDPGTPTPIAAGPASFTTPKMARKFVDWWALASSSSLFPAESST